MRRAGAVGVLRFLDGGGGLGIRLGLLDLSLARDQGLGRLELHGSRAGALGILTVLGLFGGIDTEQLEDRIGLLGFLGLFLGFLILVRGGEQSVERRD